MKIFSLLFPICLLVVACTGADESESVAAADLIFIGDNIVTIDPEYPNVSGVAVRGTEIVAVGSSDDVLGLRADTTRVIELGNQALVPGFIDAHGHMTFVGRLRELIDLSSPPVGTVETIDDLVTLVTERIAETNPEPGTWITGFGYDDSLIAENRHPTRDDLDRASTEFPIVLSHVSGHLLAVNSAALAAAGVDADSEDPPGGVIRRRPGTREPNGVMEETAMQPFRQGGKQNAQELEALFRYSADLHASYGITTVQDGGAGLGDIAILKAAAAKQPFPVDIVAFASANRLDDETLYSVEVSSEYIGGFRVGGLKFVLDGSPQGRTAYLSQPYTEGPPGASADYRAYPSYPADEYTRAWPG